MRDQFRNVRYTYINRTTTTKKFVFHTILEIMVIQTIFLNSTTQ